MALGLILTHKCLKNCNLECVFGGGVDVYVYVCLCDVCACCMTCFDMQVIKGCYGILFSMETFWPDHN